VLPLLIEGLTRMADALLAAGGFARRAGVGAPKSLMAVDGVTFLELTVRNLVAAGCKRVFVANNRGEYHARIRSLLLGFPEVRLYADFGFASTIELAREVSPLLSRRVMFCYGHAPRPATVLRQAFEKSAPFVACSFDRSSRRMPILSGARFIEPPFIIPRDSLLHSPDMSWRSYLQANVKRVELIRLDAEPEFNTLSEAARFRSFLRADPTFEIAASRA
jgi:CTP:molybdopterin cytidylyltransferase MocA